ncbi:MAG TPA: hypothetical protein VE620_15270 [Myxococcales bacterium]|nr:hypothetical protein [Myxococcales bacterium]
MCGPLTGLVVVVCNAAVWTALWHPVGWVAGGSGLGVPTTATGAVLPGVHEGDAV